MSEPVLFAGLKGLGDIAPSIGTNADTSNAAGSVHAKLKDVKASVTSTNSSIGSINSSIGSLNSSVNGVSNAVANLKSGTNFSAKRLIVAKGGVSTGYGSDTTVLNVSGPGILHAFSGVTAAGNGNGMTVRMTIDGVVHDWYQWVSSNNVSQTTSKSLTFMVGFSSLRVDIQQSGNGSSTLEVYYSLE